MTAAAEADDFTTVIMRAFPGSLADDVRACAEIIPMARLAPSCEFAVRIGNETLLIPYRIYNDEPDEARLASLAPRAQLVARCLCTRHHDGRIRERNLRQLLATTFDWVAPYVVQLAGEYVIEITRTIQAALSELANPGSAQHDTYVRFAAQNLAFIEQTRARAVSYWNEYYRRQYPTLASYPASKFLTDLKSAGQAYAVANPAEVQDR